MDRLSRMALASLFSIVSLVAQAAPVDINAADAETLATALTGIGPAKAQAIVAYRDLNGPFKSAEELALVKGIGERTVDMNRDNILVNGGGR